MASGKNFVQAYGIKSGLLTIGPMTQVIKVDPTASDVGIGTIAVNEAAQSAWILVGFNPAGVPVYKQIDNGGGTGVFAQLTVNPGPTSITGVTGITGATTIAGATNINNNINSNTSINTGTSTGTVNIGNVANGGAISIRSSDNINIESALALGLTALDITATSGITGTTLNSTGAIALTSSFDADITAVNITASGATSGINLIASAGDGTITVTSGTVGTALNSTGAIALTSSQAAAGAITLDATDAAGGITATVGTGNFNVTGGAIAMNGVNIYAGADAPPAFAAPAGSLYLSTGGSGYINTALGSNWAIINVTP